MLDRGMYEVVFVSVWSSSSITEREPEPRLPGRNRTLWARSSWRNMLERENKCYELQISLFQRCIFTGLSENLHFKTLSLADVEFKLKGGRKLSSVWLLLFGVQFLILLTVTWNNQNVWRLGCMSKCQNSNCYSQQRGAFVMSNHSCPPPWVTE